MKTEARILNLSQEGFVQCYKWFSENSVPKGIVLICHGMSEHAERYSEFAGKLVDSGFVVYANNHRGHKGSIISKAHFGYATDGNHFDILISDLYEIIQLIKQEHPQLPLFLFGHSMGSFISERFVQLYGRKIDGLILSGSSKSPKSLITFGLLISKMLCLLKGRKHRSNLLNSLSFGSYNKVFKPNRTEFDWLNRDQSEVDKYINDEYCGGIVTVSFYKDFLAGLLKINQNYELVPKELPIFIISGSDDPVGGCSKDITKLYKKYQKLEIKDLEFKLYEGARHEIIHETCKDEVMHDCLVWIEKHLK